MGVGEVVTEQTGPVAALPAANLGDTDQKTEEDSEIADDIIMHKSSAKTQESQEPEDRNMEEESSRR